MAVRISKHENVDCLPSGDQIFMIFRNGESSPGGWENTTIVSRYITIQDAEAIELRLRTAIEKAYQFIGQKRLAVAEAEAKKCTSL